MTEKKQKEKRSALATERNLKATRHLVSFFSFRPVAQSSTQKQRRGNRRQPNSEGAVAKSASGDSPFTHRRLCRNQRYNLPLLAGGDCADWMHKRHRQTAERKRNVKPKSDHADHRAPLRSSRQRDQLKPPNRQSQTQLGVKIP